ncbi:hypothetical protein EYF80_032769 [Liparis tanakae]|uniref:Uncharacterized protein n=1 Tax=Liparis tanakae TaxID=230148 RepID=A0A4Z2GU55_9TELE|nr:hypothetical protein EYF80_032769 [Liparis tanakae]
MKVGKCTSPHCEDDEEEEEEQGGERSFKQTPRRQEVFLLPVNPFPSASRHRMAKTDGPRVATSVERPLEASRRRLASEVSARRV